VTNPPTLFGNQQTSHAVRIPGFLQARAVQYEIHALVEGRWRIDEIVAPDKVEDGRDHDSCDRLENAAIERASELLAAGGGIAAVKVVRERRRGDGFATTREIFAKDAPPARETPLLLGRLPGPAKASAPAQEWCADPADLYRRAACRLISVLLRSFLDRWSITPLELLHFGPYARRLEDNWGLVGGAINHIAQARAKAADGDASAEAARLGRLVEAAIVKARMAEAQRRLPSYAGDFPAWAEAVSGLVGAAEASFYRHVAIARHLAGMPGYLGRLEFALDGLDQGAAGDLAAELDAFAAGCLESPQLVMDLLGPQPNLGTALLALADLANGRCAAKGLPETAVRLQTRLRGGALPLCLPVLWERIERELARPKPLSRRESGQEWALLMRLRDVLPEAAPAVWRAPIEAALAERVRRVQEAAT